MVNVPSTGKPNMKRLTASELVRNFGEYSDSALTEPAIITRNGRDRLVLLNIEEYHALRHVADMGENLREAKTAQSERHTGRIIMSRRARKAGDSVQLAAHR